MTNRICIEASPAIHRQAGIGRYALNLIRALINIDPTGDYAIAYNNPGQAVLPYPLQDLPRYTSPLKTKAWRLRNVATHFGLAPMDSFYNGANLYHSTGHLLPRLRHVRTVLTLHDVIPLLLPTYHRTLNRMFFRVMLPHFLDKADEIIAVSKSTKRDAIALLGVSPDRITVIPEGVSPNYQRVTNQAKLAHVRASYGLPDTFILCVATIEPRKNHITLLRAFELIHKDHPDLALVLAGARGWLYHDFLSALENSAARHHVKLLGRVPDHDLPALMSAATMFTFPSHYEGFGLPPLEAMACGLPVITSTSSSLPELVGNAAILCNSTNVDEWYTAIDLLLHNPELRLSLASRGRKRAAAFTWDSTASATLAVYERALTA